MTQRTICSSTRSRLLCCKDGAGYHLRPECRVIFQHPQPLPDVMVSYAENEYETGVYCDYVEARETKLEHLRRYLERLLTQVRRGRLLDIGCSCGIFMEVAAANGFEVEGLEFSRAAIAATGAAIRSRIFCSSVVEFESTRSYDLITVFDLIEYVPSPRTSYARSGVCWHPEDG